MLLVPQGSHLPIPVDTTVIKDTLQHTHCTRGEEYSRLYDIEPLLASLRIVGDHRWIWRLVASTPRLANDQPWDGGYSTLLSICMGDRTSALHRSVSSSTSRIVMTLLPPTQQGPYSRL